MNDDARYELTDFELGDHLALAAQQAASTKEFLAFSKAAGNDLSTPLPQYGFPGVKPGDRWCLCAPR